MAAFWLRPLLLEVGLGLALALLYWWEVARLSLIQPQVGPFPIVPPMLALHLQYFSHVILLCWMLAASFIDIDEKIIPDEITVTGTMLGLLIAAIVPMSLLPHVSEPLNVPVVGEPLVLAKGGFAIGPHGIAQWLEPVTAVARGLGRRRGACFASRRRSRSDLAATGCGVSHWRREFGAAGAGR